MQEAKKSEEEQAKLQGGHAGNALAEKIANNKREQEKDAELERQLSVMHAGGDTSLVHGVDGPKLVKTVSKSKKSAPSKRLGRGVKRNLTDVYMGEDDDADDFEDVPPPPP